ncbi:uncharacterized protein LOC115710278 isoform X1 [Cannabis sativa]|uniref:uncharacterized protein LOC115710278 isoform X1 n=1 Tax=Cannabis sativa TaxID=3483 RepID=UPI0029C9D825|nr:uncharacterized protein LOC115710278 isoform X1 [Cannabis sativa]
MDNMNVSESILAWRWLIEAMASFKEVDLFLLCDVMEAAPELPDGLGKNTREIVALRCLEQLSSVNEIASDVPSAQGLKVGFDLSESCEDVLQRIVEDTSGRILRISRMELSRWDIQPFVAHKRACMPKCALEQLKDAILDGTHPYADFLRDKGHLATSLEDANLMGDSNHDSVTTRPCFTGTDVQNEVNPDILIPEKRNKPLGENHHDRAILPTKRDRSGSAREAMACNVHEDCNGELNSELQHTNAKRLKQYESSGSQFVEQNQFPLHGNEALEDSSGRDAPVTTRELPENELATMGESRVLENGFDDECNKNNDDHSNKDMVQTPCNSPVMPKINSGDEANQPLSVDEANVVSNHFAQLGGAFEPVEQNSVALHGKEPTKDSSKLEVQVPVEEPKLTEDDCTVSNRSQPITGDEIYKNQSENFYDAPSLMQDATRDDTHQNLSVDGTNNASDPSTEPIGVPSHGTVDKIPTKESKRIREHDFPFQERNPMSNDRYQQNIIAGEAKENTNDCGEEEMPCDIDGYRNEMVDVDKKKLEFLQAQCTVGRDSLIVDWTEKYLCMKCNKAGSLLVCSTNNCQLVIHEKCGGSLAKFDDKGNFYCPFCAYSLAIMEYIEAKKRSSVANKELAAFILMGSKRYPKESARSLIKEINHSPGGNAAENVLRKNLENEHLGAREKNEGNLVELSVNEEDDQQCQKIKVDQAEISAQHNNNDSNRGGCHGSEGEREGGEKMAGECPSARTEGQQNEVPHNASGRNSDVNLVNEGKSNTGIQRKLLKDQDIYTKKRSVTENHDSSGDDSENDDHESNISDYCILFRKRKKPRSSDPATPQKRRKKVPWTTEEEQKLKEGVQKFPDEKNMWKKILEFGDSVFMEGRTAIDLKDKWRNMCKGMPK